MVIVLHTDIFIFTTFQIILIKDMIQYITTKHLNICALQKTNNQPFKNCIIVKLLFFYYLLNSVINLPLNLSYRFHKKIDNKNCLPKILTC